MTDEAAEREAYTTYVQQLESKLAAFEKMDENSWRQLGEQDKVIDRLTAEVAKLQAMALLMIERELYPERHVT